MASTVTRDDVRCCVGGGRRHPHNIIVAQARRLLPRLVPLLNGTGATSTGTIATAADAVTPYGRPTTQRAHPYSCDSYSSPNHRRASTTVEADNIVAAGTTTG